MADPEELWTEQAAEDPAPGRDDPPAADAAPAEDTALDNTSFSLAENEKRLASILSQIEGAGRVEVMLTVTGSTERVIAEDVSRTETRQQDSLERTEDRETVVLGSGSDQNVVELKLNYPKYTGAVVVADGAGSAQVRLEIVSAVSAATGLASDRISVSKMEKP